MGFWRMGQRSGFPRQTRRIRLRRSYGGTSEVTPAFGGQPTRGPGDALATENQFGGQATLTHAVHFVGVPTIVADQLGAFVGDVLGDDCQEFGEGEDLEIGDLRFTIYEADAKGLGSARALRAVPAGSASCWRRRVSKRCFTTPPSACSTR